ncbi:hypothetical protein [Streptomyces sp. NPDC101149]
MRTTSENLGARTKAHRTKQGSSVHYTAPTEQDTTRQTDEAQTEESQ